MENEITYAVKNLMTSKVRRIKTELRNEFGDAFLKMSKGDFLKLIEKENEESLDFIKEQLRNIYRTRGAAAMKDFVKEYENYSDEEFLKDASGIFTERDTLFLKSILAKNHLE